MKKMTFKTIAIRTMAMAALALTLGACSENEKEMPDTTPKGEKITFTASLPGADTRLSHSDPTLDGVTVKWTEQDQLKLFAMDGSPSLGTFTVVENSISPNGKSASFEGTAQMGTGTYLLFGPGDKIPDDDQGYDFLFSFLGQKQNINNGLDHLKDYNFILSMAIDGDMTNLTFTHGVALFQFNLTDLPAGTYNNFVIKSSVADGILSGARVSPSSSAEYAQELPMELNNIAPAVDGSLTLWMMMFAGNIFKPGTLTLEVTGTNNKTYTNVTPITIGTGGKTYDAGKRYTMTTAMQEVVQQTELDRLVDWVQNDGWKSTGFTLTQDIDLTGVSFTPIGDTNTPFNQIFDGGGYTISGLAVNNTLALGVGLFGYSTGTVRNATVKGTITGGMRAGGVVGWNAGTIENCAFEGTITGSSMVGGITGYNTGNCTVSNCVSKATVTGSADKIGGIVGYNLGLTVGCSATQSTVSGTFHVGGIAGYAESTIIACLADNVNITANYNNDTALGGIVGYTTKSNITACVSAPVALNMQGGGTPRSGAVAGQGTSSAFFTTNYWRTGGTGYSNGLGVDNYDQEQYCPSFSGSFPSAGITALNGAITTWNGANNNKCPFKFEANGALPKLVANQ